MRYIATIGFFDGVHRGHQFLFGHLQDEAQKRGLAPLIITFSKHPRQVLQLGYQPQLLSTLSERVEKLEHFADVEVLDFEQVRRLTAQQFIAFLHSKYDVDALLVGYDHRFGSDRMSDPDQLRKIGEKEGVDILHAGQLPTIETNGIHISSTAIRHAIQEGDIELANSLLGHSYTICGKVVHGRGLGRTIGFPTANIEPDEPGLLLPRPGVYAVQVDLGHGSLQPAILNIGTNPTIGLNPLTIEMHIPGLDLDLYGRELAVQVERFIRAEQQFEDFKELKQQISEDLKKL